MLENTKIHNPLPNNLRSNCLASLKGRVISRLTFVPGAWTRLYFLMFILCYTLFSFYWCISGTMLNDWLRKRRRNDLFCVEWDVKHQLDQLWSRPSPSFWNRGRTVDRHLYDPRTHGVKKSWQIRSVWASTANISRVINSTPPPPTKLDPRVKTYLDFKKGAITPTFYNSSVSVHSTFEFDFANSFQSPLLWPPFLLWPWTLTFDL